MKRFLHAASAFAGLIALPATADAQQGEGPPVETPGVSGRADQSDKGISVEFLAIGSDGVATLALQNTNLLDVDDYESTDRRKGREVKKFNWRVAASAPIGDGDDFTDIGTLDSLASGFKFEVNFSKSSSKLLFADDDKVNEWVAEAQTYCLKSRAAQRSTNAATFCANERALGDVFVRRYLPGGAAKLNSHIHQGTLKYGATASVGYDEFSYRDAATLLESSENKISFEGSAYATWLFPSSFTSITGQVKYQYGYKPGDSQILCPPNPTNIVIQCFNDPVGAPMKNKGFQFVADMRHYIGSVFGTPMAISPQLTYDVSDDVVGIDVPLYLVSDGEGGLTGGVRAGWRSDTDKFVVGIFVGTRFGHKTD
jgi:hypothetical protein